MSWWGKVMGGAFGFLAGGPLGAVLGAAVGHSLDRGLGEENIEAVEGARERVQMAFFTATFAVMGRLAKADGRVSEDEIAFARAVMVQMQLPEAQRRLAIDLFRQGKAPGFDLDGVVQQFRSECHRRHTLMQMFLEIQMQAAYADGQMDPKERELLLHVFEQLGFTRHEFEHLDALVRAFRGGAGAGADSGTGAGQAREPSPATRLKEAYAVLDVPEGATDAEVKRAYRRLMNQHHPDKLVAKGLPEEMMKVAAEKTHQIKSAYEAVKASRGMR